MSRVLLLNASYEPLSVVSPQRALSLLFGGKVETVHESTAIFNSPSVSVVVPSVIRLMRYVTVPYGRSVALTTRNVLARDHHVCAYCGKLATTTDHIVPRCNGGSHSWENVVAACTRCNGKKGAKTVKEMGWVLHRVPYRPLGREAWLMRFTPEPEWMAYLDKAG